MRSPKYTVLIANRQTGAVRRLTVVRRPAVLVILAVLAVPVLMGLGARWSAQAEIDRLAHELAVEHLALIPLSLYFKDGRVKVELGVARGRKKADKRQALAERDVKMEMAKAMGRQAKGRV